MRFGLFDSGIYDLHMGGTGQEYCKHCKQIKDVKLLWCSKLPVFFLTSDKLMTKVWEKHLFKLNYFIHLYLDICLRTVPYKRKKSEI